MIMRELLICWPLLVAGTWLLARIAMRSWARPERFDSSWTWTRPAPARSVCPIGPQPMTIREGATHYRDLIDWAPRTGDGHRRNHRVRLADAVTVVVNAGQGATEDWSPMAEHAEATARRLTLDDVDEWLAARLKAYDHALSRIDMGAGSAFDVELARFRRGSMRLHEYRSMILDATGDYGPREHMQLEELLAAA